MLKFPVIIFLLLSVVSRGIRFCSASCLFCIIKRYYNLEELEDKETCTTEIYLKSDKSLQVGKTDGPLYLNAAGSWSQEPDGTFRMTLKRWYNAGKTPTSKTDIGEFQFEVERLFVGVVTTVGGVAAVSGSMHHVDEDLDREVGFFNLIDTSDERQTK